MRAFRPGRQLGVAGPCAACAGGGGTDSGEARWTPRLLEILVCPITKGPLDFHKDKQELWSVSARLAYPIRDGIPVMLEDEARQLTDEEVAQSR